MHSNTIRIVLYLAIVLVLNLVDLNLATAVYTLNFRQNITLNERIVRHGCFESTWLFQIFSN